MAKRKKHPRLPNSFGSVRYLGKNRTNPYAVHPPATDTDTHGNYIRPKALCYVDDWYVGFAVLNAYHAGNYAPGDEIKFKSYRPADEGNLDSFCKRLLTDFTAHAYVKNEEAKNKKTFAQVYEMFMAWKYDERHGGGKYSASTKYANIASFKNCTTLHGKAFADLRIEELQTCLDSCEHGKATLRQILSLLKQMYKFAEMHELCERDCSRYLVLPDVDECEHGVPFSDEELVILWNNVDDCIVAMTVVMCYSGYRIKAYKNIEVNTDDWFFKGGVKTAAGKERTVPIHTAIRPLVEKILSRNNGKMMFEPSYFRTQMYKKLEELGIERHTPHDCRHTFSRLCEKYGVNENDRKRMLGHSFGNDITNGVYGHRTLEDLREQIEKIKVP